MSGSTTQLNDGPGDVWTVTAPPGVTVTPTNDPTTGLTTALNIAVDYDYADYNGAGQPNSIPGSHIVELSFTGPVTDPNGMPLIPGGSYPGLIAPTTIELTNDLGVPISGYTYNLINNSVTLGTEPMDTSGQDAHPDDYAHFHSVTDTSLVNTADDTFNAVVSVLDPLGQPAAFGPPQANQTLPAPSTIEGQGTIQPGATELLSGVDAGGVTLHSEDTPGPDGGSFVMDIFPQSVLGTPTPSVLLTITSGDTDFQAGAETNDSFIFAGTSPTDLPTLTFIGNFGGLMNEDLFFHPAFDTPPPDTVGALIITGTLGVGSQPNFGNINQLPGADVEVTGGLHISDGSMTDAIFSGTSLTVDGNSNIDNGGTFAIDGSGEIILKGTVTIGSMGNNLLDLSQGTVVGGTIIQNGGVVNATSVSMTDFQVNGGALQIGALASFQATIGEPSGPAIGQFGEVNVFNEQNVAQASLDTTTGLLTLQDSGGNALGSLQFASTDDLTGLHVSNSASSPGVVTITDPGNAAFSPIPITFTT